MINHLYLKHHIIHQVQSFCTNPHIIYESSSCAINAIGNYLDCKFGIFPMLPRYGADGTMDPYNFDDDFEELGNVLVWNEWGNEYNQEYIKECCDSRIGVFDTNHVVIVDVNIDFQKLILFWEGNCLTSEERIFRYIPQLLEIIDWAIIHIYESDSFVFIAHEKLTHQVDQIKDYFTKIKTQHICITDV